MQYYFFNEFCPFEVGDYVRFKNTLGDIYTADDVYIIDDILTISSFKDKKTVFKIVVHDDGGKEVGKIGVDDLLLIRTNREVGEKNDKNTL